MWVNGAMLSFDQDDDTYMETVWDALDPKSTQSSLDSLTKWEKNRSYREKPSPELFPGGCPPLDDPDWYYDKDTSFYRQDEAESCLVYVDGDYMSFTKEEIESGSMAEELAEIQDKAIKEWEATLMAKQEDEAREYYNMWGLDYDDDDDVYTQYYGVQEGGYDVNEDLEGMSDSPLEDK